MKRTAKWHKHLTMGELRHLKEMGITSIAGFSRNRTEQRRLKARLDVHKAYRSGEWRKLSSAATELAMAEDQRNADRMALKEIDDELRGARRCMREGS